MPPTEFLADRKEAGKTIATVLRSRFNLPWSQAKRMIERGHVRVAGFACHDPGLRVKAKNRVWVREGVLPGSPTNAEPAPKRTAAAANAPAAKRERPATPAKREPIIAAPPPLPLDSSAIVYADDSVVVVNKPAGLTTMRHETEADEFGPRGKKFLPMTLADFLPRLLGSPNRPVLPVHRIDRDTSGLVAFAKTPHAAAMLDVQFRKHAVDRVYLALVRGTPSDRKIESRIDRDRGDGRRGSVSGDAGKRAVTYVKVKEQFDGFALVECRLETGRTHQVRIHLGEAGWPLCGETVYDRPLDGQPLPDASGAGRPMLHATRLGFAHPETAAEMAWEIPPPPDFAAVLARVSSRAMV